MRQRAESPAAAIGARDAISAAWACALEIAVATSSVKPASRASMSAGSGSVGDPAIMTQPALDVDRSADGGAASPVTGDV
jgi:hypothetical protein